MCPRSSRANTAQFFGTTGQARNAGLPSPNNFTGDKIMSETAKSVPRESCVGIPEIVGLITRALVSVGVPPEDAGQVAALMAESDARGGDAHGVFRLPQYVKQIQDGAINPRPNIRVLNEKSSVALMDGDNGLG